MSATFTAGQKLRAVDAVPQKVWTVASTTATSAVGTTETVVATAPASTYRAGRAYLLSFRGLSRCNTAATAMWYRIRDTNSSGTIRMDGGYHQVVAAGSNYWTHWEHVVANTGGGDITGRVLVMTIFSSSANTVLINAGPAIPWYINCVEVGAAADFPEAVAL